MTNSVRASGRKVFDGFYGSNKKYNDYFHLHFDMKQRKEFAALKVWKEIAKLEARVDVLADALYDYKAEEEDGFAKEARKVVVERQIAAIYHNLNLLSNQFSVANINTYLEQMTKESDESVGNE